MADQLGLHQPNGDLKRTKKIQDSNTDEQMPKNPHQHRIGSKWTHLDPVDRDKHFEVLRVYSDRDASDAQATTYAELRAVISKRVLKLAITELQNQDLWRPDWR